MVGWASLRASVLAQLASWFVGRPCVLRCVRGLGLVGLLDVLRGLGFVGLLDVLRGSVLHVVWRSASAAESLLGLMPRASHAPIGGRFFLAVACVARRATDCTARGVAPPRAASYSVCGLPCGAGSGCEWLAGSSTRVGRDAKARRALHAI